MLFRRPIAVVNALPARKAAQLSVAGVLAFAVAGCSADIAMFRADSSWWSTGSVRSARTIGPESLVAADGSCLTVEGQEAPRGISLGMAECDLVRLAGPTTQVSIAANERGERTAVLTYPQGERAGIYRFTSGTLVSIERVAEPPAPARAKKQKRKSKPS